MNHIKSLFTRQKPIYYSFLFSYIFVLMIPLIFGTGIYRKSFAAARNETQSAFMSALIQTRTVVDSRIGEIKNIASTFRINNHVQSNMHIRETPTPLQRYSFSELQKELITFKISYSLIKGVDIYFPNGGYVLGTRSRYKSNDLNEMAQMYYHISLDEWKRLSTGEFYQKYITISNGQGGNDLLYILSLDSSPKDTHSAVLLITLDGTRLLSEMFDPKMGDMYLSWENGTVMNSDFSSPTKEIADIAGYSSISEKDTVFRANIDSNTVSILHTPSSIANFEYVRIIQMSTLYQKATEILVTVYIYIILCLVIGIAVSFRFSKNRYDPIDRIMRMIPTVKGTDAPIGKFSTLEKSLSALFLQQKLLENTLKKQRNEIRNAFLSKLVKGELPYQERNYAEAVTLDIQLSKDKYYCISGFTITDFGTGFAPDGEPDSKSIELAEYSIQNIVDELVSARHPCYVFVCDGSVCCLASSESPDQLKEDLLSTASTAIDFFTEKLLVSVAAAVTNASFGYTSIPKLYLEATTSLEYKLLMNTPGKVITTSYFDTSTCAHSVSMHLFRRFETAMQIGNMEDVHSALCSMIDHAMNDPMKTSRLVKVRIASIADFTLTALSRFGHMLPSYEMDRLIDKILASKSFEELLVNITHTFGSLHQTNAAVTKVSVSMELITEYIRKNCFDANFSLTLLADHFKMNSSYLSRRFKSFVGVGIAEYIQILRFEQAKELLRNTDQSIPSIAAMVGYYSAQAFSNAFKKATGMSPSRYKASTPENIALQ